MGYSQHFYWRDFQLGTEFTDNDSYTYTYDNVGNITSIKKGTRTSTNPEEAGFKTVSGAAAYRSYEYDALGQLKRENNKSKNATAEWNYDILGNIESTITYDYTTGDVGDRRTAIDYQYTNNGKAGWNKLLTTLVHKEYGYNTAGRYINKQTVEDIDYEKIGNPVSYN